MTAPLATPRIRIPRSARAGEVIEVRTLMEHPMQTGLGAQAPPRDMLARLVVRMNGEVLLAADYRNGSAANPYHVFFVRMERSSVFDFAWTDERGRSTRAEARVTVG